MFFKRCLKPKPTTQNISNPSKSLDIKLYELFHHIDSKNHLFKTRESVYDVVQILLPDEYKVNADPIKLNKIIELKAELYVQLKSLYSQPKRGKRNV